MLDHGADGVLHRAGLGHDVEEPAGDKDNEEVGGRVYEAAGDGDEDREEKINGSAEGEATIAVA
ncbi:hypothetical protein GCM10011324_39970 [Allosediminivita pacifica]|nr:hypothetical protein GCM10011324_39970 [Allosediminivita pacifica]